MFGFFIGIACLWGLVRVVKGRRHGYGPWGARGGACGGGPFGRHRRHRWEDEDSWEDAPQKGAFFLRGIFRRLDTTPGQEKEIQRAVEEVIDAGKALKSDVKGSRRDVAEAFRSDDFNEELMASLLTRHDERIDELRQAMVAGLAKVHVTLDPDQRKQLARMLERGPGWGPYRSRHA